MNPMKGTPAYWKHFLFEVLAMVKQLSNFLHDIKFSDLDIQIYSGMS